MPLFKITISHDGGSWNYCFVEASDITKAVETAITVERKEYPEEAKKLWVSDAMTMPGKLLRSKK